VAEWPLDPELRREDERIARERVFPDLTRER
jgi:hypothetical protein